MEIRSTLVVVAVAALILLGLDGAVAVVCPGLVVAHHSPTAVKVVVEYPERGEPSTESNR